MSADFCTTDEAARRLGMTRRRVQQLLDTGDLTRVARGLVDATSLDRHLAAHPTGRTRAWAESTAWAAVALLSGARVDWLGASQTSRLRAALRDTADPAELVARTRGRAVVRTFTGHSSAVRRLADRLVVADRATLGLTAGDVDWVDGYLDAAALDATAASFGLREDPVGAITLRATAFDLDAVARLADGPVLAALDAATSLDPRERGVGERVLTGVLEGAR
ncbi:helix-turn-helix domain-containing protein [Marmoricola endophyticus]|uniref:helix-turn-helix domain-containing protein n=1 Tax=Marmoricola endophyticus TaxID=2040280 RepID=UPI00166D5E53|nr:helix-turn-helix domain-containing protein [Marmoricola endophyticus]